MSLNCLVSDFVARTKNAIRAQKPTYIVIKNNLVTEICKKFVRLGYFTSFEIMEGGKTIEININLNKITDIRRVSKPGKRVYTSYQEMPKIVGGIGWNILSTSQGVMTNHEAKTKKVGGELILQVL
jgi:small subunit ribosomal protein S8